MVSRFCVSSWSGAAADGVHQGAVMKSGEQGKPWPSQFEIFSKENCKAFLSGSIKLHCSWAKAVLLIFFALANSCRLVSTCSWSEPNHPIAPPNNAHKLPLVVKICKALHAFTLNSHQLATLNLLTKKNRDTLRQHDAEIQLIASCSKPKGRRNVEVQMSCLTADANATATAAVPLCWTCTFHHFPSFQANFAEPKRPQSH